MVAQWIVEKYKQREREIGIKIGLERGLEQGRKQGREQGIKQSREELQREWESWYERQQAAFREGRPFDEPTPGHSPDTPDLSK